MAVSESGTYPFLGVSALGGMEGGTTHTHTRARAQRLRAESPDVDIQLAHDGLHVPLRL